MLGYSINIYPKTRYRRNLKHWEREAFLAERLMRWETSLGGTDWADELVRQGKAVLMAYSDGYPTNYEMSFSAISEFVGGQIPKHKGTPVIGEDYFMEVGHIGEVEVFSDKLALMSPDDLVVVETWDLS